VNQYYSAATENLITQSGFETEQLKSSLDESIEAATTLLHTYRKMIKNGTATLEQYNELAVTILNKTLGTYSKNKSGLDFATGTIDASAL
jgi:hypothetical protein